MPGGLHHPQWTPHTPCRHHPQPLVLYYSDSFLFFSISLTVLCTFLHYSESLLLCSSLQDFFVLFSSSPTYSLTPIADPPPQTGRKMMMLKMMMPSVPKMPGGDDGDKKEESAESREEAKEQVSFYFSSCFSLSFCFSFSFCFH